MEDETPEGRHARTTGRFPSHAEQILVIGKTLLVFLALSALLYLALCGLLYAKQRALIYFPGETRVSVEQTDIKIDRGDVTLRGWVVNSGQPSAILYFG